jgi:hypothetical protein
MPTVNENLRWVWNRDYKFQFAIAKSKLLAAKSP